MVHTSATTAAAACRPSSHHTQTIITPCVGHHHTTRSYNSACAATTMRVQLQQCVWSYSNTYGATAMRVKTHQHLCKDTTESVTSVGCYLHSARMIDPNETEEFQERGRDEAAYQHCNKRLDATTGECRGGAVGAVCSYCTCSHNSCVMWCSTRSS